MGCVDSKRHFAALCSLWYPVAACLRRFFIAIARVAVNEDESGRTAVGPLCLSAGSIPKEKQARMEVKD